MTAIKDFKNNAILMIIFTKFKKIKKKIKKNYQNFKKPTF